MLELLRPKLGKIPDEIGFCAGSLQTWKYLLDNGLTPNAQDSSGRTLLAQLAPRIDASFDSACNPAGLEQVYLVRLLLDHGADPKRTAADGSSALEQAHAAGRPRIEELLTTEKIRMIDKNGTPTDCPPT
jgi:hypothetical protein